MALPRKICAPLPLYLTRRRRLGPGRRHALLEAALNSLPFPTRGAGLSIVADGLPADCPARGEPPGFCPKLDLLSMVNALTEGILVCGADRCVSYANPSAARLLGLPLD